MKKKRSLLILAEVAIVAGFSFSFYQYVQTEIEPKEVYVFNTDLEVNTQITKGDLKVVTVPASAVTKGFAIDSENIVGKYVTTDVFADTFVYSEQLIEKDTIDPFKSMDLSELRKVTIPVDLESAFAGDLKRGDQVDVLYTGKGEDTDGQEFFYSKVFIQNAYVYNVTTDDGYKYENTSGYTKSEAELDDQGEAIATSAENGDIANVTLAVPLAQAEEISARLASGEVRLVGRFDDSQSYETLGFVVGKFGKVFAERQNAETSKGTINGN